MRRSIVTMTVSLVLLFVTVGCDDTPAETSASQKVEAAKKVSNIAMEKRKTAFEKKIEALKGMGFDVNNTEMSKEKSTYLLTVKDARVATSALLGLSNMGTMDLRSQKAVSKVINGARIGMEIDWQQYASNSWKSVFLYFMGTGRESAVVQKMIREKKLGAYLTFDAKDRLKEAMIKEINEKIIRGSDTIRLVLQGARLEIQKPATETFSERAFTLKGGELVYSIEKNGTKVFDFSYKNPICDIKKSSDYLGKQVCRFPLIQIDTVAGKDVMKIGFKSTELMYATTLHEKKVKADALFHIADIDIQAKDGEKDLAVQLKDFKIDGFSDNLDETLLKAFYTLASHPPKDRNQTFQQSMKLIGKLFGNGVVFNYNMALASAEGKSTQGAKTTLFMLDSYQGQAKASFGKTISYSEKSMIKNITVKEEKAKSPLFAMKNFRFGYGVKEIYNFIPDFMEFAMMAAQKEQRGEKISKEEEKKITAIGTQIVNNGFGLSFDPVGIDALSMDMMGKAVSYGGMALNIDAKLNKNSVKFDNPMSAMMLLSFLQADGKLVLSKADLDQMSRQFSPQMMAMVMMYAKYEGDKAIFVLKFEKGHLMVNDKPVM